MKHNVLQNGIPVSISLTPALEAEDFQPAPEQNKKRLLLIAALAVAIAVIVSGVAKLLVYLIDLFTNIAYFQRFSIAPADPADNSYGLWSIVVPVIGGLIVGLMALYGSKAIRGHGIPEAMEQILTNKSKIKPSVAYLKPLSAAISIGTGGPFGAEGPIIATGGALGSTVGQLLKITNSERKILLAAGATAGMSAIFGSPVAAIFLAIELLLFEFSPRSFIPVALACVTGAAGHHLFFEEGYVFGIDEVIASPTTSALFAYGVMGIAIGLLSVLVSKIVYIIEDLFEKLPIHWAWWPAIGGLAVGIVGYFYPKTLGVGYSNITEILSGNLTMQVILSLCIFKFISWAISLGSGTSGGTLAPLLTIGGATGALLGSVVLYWFPASGVSIPLSGLVGMSAMFAGASRAFLTSIVFALETTGQSNALLPLLATCTSSYFVSYFISPNTIMTEKIARRGVRTPHSYEPDLLDTVSVGDVLSESIVISDENTIAEVREWLAKDPEHTANYYIIASADGEYRGVVSSSNLYNAMHAGDKKVGEIIKRGRVHLDTQSTLRAAVELMAAENIDLLPVVSDGKIAGILSYEHIIRIYGNRREDHEGKRSAISLKQRGLRMVVKGSLSNAVRGKRK